MMNLKLIQVFLIIVAITYIYGNHPVKKSCYDTGNCAKYVKRGYCKPTANRDHYKYMKKNCMKSCGWCEDCYDTGKCAKYVERGYCKPTANPDHYRYMKKNCIKSCGWCDAPKTTVTPPISTFTRPLAKGCGISSVQNSRIIGGETAIKGAWPWIARLYTAYTDKSWCGGTLISPTLVVTASHCMRRKSAMQIEVQLGRHSMLEKDSFIQRILVKRVIKHPKYHFPTPFSNDVALLELAKPAQLNNRVNIVCLPKHDQPVPIGTECVVAGWGKTHHGKSAVLLQQTNLNIISNKLCHSRNRKNIGISVVSSMVCATAGANKINSGCHGDSGGPLMCKQNGRYVLHGDVSWGDTHCDASKGFNVFGRMTTFRKWIDEYIN